MRVIDKRNIGFRFFLLGVFVFWIIVSSNQEHLTEFFLLLSAGLVLLGLCMFLVLGSIFLRSIGKKR